MQTISKIICLIKGHIGLHRNTVYERCYNKIPAGRGAFCRDPERYKRAGRLYKCARCGALRRHRGICGWEIGDWMNNTLKDFPDHYFNQVWTDNQNYEFIRIYGK